MWLPVLRAELGVLRGYGLAKDARHANDAEMLIQLADDPASRLVAVHRIAGRWHGVRPGL